MTPSIAKDLELSELDAAGGLGGWAGTSMELKDNWLTLENALAGSTSYGSLKAARELTEIVTACRHGKEVVRIQPLSALVLDWYALLELGLFSESGPFSLSPATAIEDWIESSRAMLDLGADWDGEGALPISKSTWNRAVEFLRTTALSLWSKCGLKIEAPVLVPVSDGSIDIHWKLSNRELLINVPADATKWAAYYGDNRHGGNTVEGQLDTSAPNHWLLVWLTD